MIECGSLNKKVLDLDPTEAGLCLSAREIYSPKYGYSPRSIGFFLTKQLDWDVKLLIKCVFCCVMFIT